MIARGISRQACGGGDQPFTVEFQQFLVDPRFVIMPVNPGEGDQSAEVLVAFKVFGNRMR